MRVLLIEDNSDYAGLLVRGLAKRAIEADHAGSLEDAAHYLGGCEYEAIILDFGLPDGDGMDWLCAQNEARPPVLVLTARGTLDERVLGLDTGADDYLVKPAEIEEIAARLRAITRRPGVRETLILTAGTLSLDTTSRQVTVGKAPIAFGRRETAFLELLLRRIGTVVVREQIEAVLYGLDDAVTPNALEAVASRVRRRLAEAGLPDIIHTVRGVGYFIEGHAEE